MILEETVESSMSVLDGNVFSSSESDEEGDSNNQNLDLCSDSESERERKRRRTNSEDDDYIEFISSVLSSVDKKVTNDGESDDESEEDYLPDLEQESKDEDDEEDDTEYVKVARNEVHDLVGGCWQVIADPIGQVSDCKNIGGSDSIETLPLSNDLPAKNLDKSKESLRNTSVISSLVSQLFAGGNLAEVCVDGISIETLRKLVARQMSMALQLLTQILLVSDNKSDCFSKAYSKIIELSNMREGTNEIYLLH